MRRYVGFRQLGISHLVRSCRRLVNGWLLRKSQQQQQQQQQQLLLQLLNMFYTYRTIDGLIGL